MPGLPESSAPPGLQCPAGLGRVTFQPATTLAPWISACDNLPSATSPFGSNTTQPISARAAYAAAMVSIGIVLPREVWKGKKMGSSKMHELRWHHTI